MSKNQVNITYYQFNIKLKLFNNSITKEKYAFWLYFYAFGHLKLTKNENKPHIYSFFKVVRKREFQIITDHINIH